MNAVKLSAFVLCALICNANVALSESGKPRVYEKWEGPNAGLTTYQAMSVSALDTDN